MVRGVPVAREHLAEYSRVCGYRIREELPATYPHAMAFPLVMRLMAAKDFPMPPFGLVQVGQAIDVLRPVSAGESLDLRARIEPPNNTHPDGQRVDITITATIDDTAVWSGRSVYLNRSAGIASAVAGSGQDTPAGPGSGTDGPVLTPQAIGRASRTVPVPTAVLRVPRRVGRQYARVSGDHDPIHTSYPAARILGFPGPVAHPCWALARCLSTLDGRLGAAFRVRAEFTAPIPLPMRLGFSALPASSSGWRFAAWGLHTERHHVIGTITPK